MRPTRTLGAILLAAAVAAAPAHASEDPPAGPAPGQGGSAEARQPPDDFDRDRTVDLAQPDFALVGLPTTLRVPRFRSAFRVTHRFTRPLGQGSFGDLAEDLFGLDSSALIGLEFRFGVARGAQIGIHRTSNRTIQLFGQYNLLNQRDDRPLSLDVLAGVEGLDNFRDAHAASVGVLVGRAIGTRAALYVEPIWVADTQTRGTVARDEGSVVLVGLGARVRVRPTVYLVGEVVPRAGAEGGVTYGAFGIEKRAGGHLFQLNFSNAPATTLRQIARGGIGGDDWFIGFNISRKFY